MLTRVAPFYSPLRGIALEDLWHDHDAGQLGQHIARTALVLN
ncbi:hypothetical protein [Hymenobacter coccineus]|nr:hypothetical protein [Hymenobacter coccineus]